MDSEKLKGILAQADGDAKGWETNRKGTTENGLRYVREDIALAATELASVEAMRIERERCVDIVYLARLGEIDQDFRSIGSRIKSGSLPPARKE